MQITNKNSEATRVYFVTGFRIFNNIEVLD